MNEKILDTLIHEGYKAEELYKYENCIHQFGYIPYFDFDKMQINKVLVCVKCLMSEHVALTMGLDPMYYEDKEKMV